MGCCASDRRPNRTSIKVHVDQNEQTKFLITNPKLKCRSFYPAQFICTNKNCQIRPVYHCQNPLCIICPQLHAECSFFKLTSLTDLLQKKCNEHQIFVNKITAIQTDVIEKIKHNRLQRIQNMLVSNLTPQYAQIIYCLYFDKPGTTIKRKMKENNNKDGDSEGILEQYQKNAQQFADRLRETGDNVLVKATSTVQINIEQKIASQSRQIRDYGYTGLTNRMQGMPEAEKQSVKTLQIVNTQCKSILTKAQKSNNLELVMKYLESNQAETKLQAYGDKGQNFIEEAVKTYPISVNIALFSWYDSIKLSAQTCYRYSCKQILTKSILGFIQKINCNFDLRKKPFAQEIAAFKNMENLELAFYHHLMDQSYFKDLVEVINMSLSKLKHFKLKISPQTNKLVSKYNWTSQIRDEIEVQVLKEDIKNSQLAG